MRKLLVVLLTVACTGCASFSPYGGVSAHVEKLDSPEVNLSTGLGFFGTEYQHESWKDFHLFCEHISGLSISELGAGLNHCGFVLRK